jgi:dihydroorotate dehydrogenase electron transfer subunit
VPGTQRLGVGESELASARGTAVYTCGPTPMMKAVALLALEREVPCQVSMETFMPCGVGICVGCALPLPDGTFARACTDGPVFFASEVVW